MEAAWGEDDVLAKLAVNSLIGLWAIDDCYSHKMRSSSYESDAPAGALKQTFHYGDGLVYDFISSTQLLGNASCRPLHDLCMCTEAVRMGQMLYSLRQARAVVYEFKTDSVLYKPLKRTPPKLAELRFRDLDTLRLQLEPSAEGARRLDERHLVSPIPCDSKPFRVMEATQRDLMKTNPLLPSRSWELEEQGRAWSTLAPDEAERRVLEGESLLCVGIAGTGKTTYLQGVVERLRSSGKKVDIVSKTHVASNRAGGVTADHWVRRHVLNGTPSCDCLWVDEISQLDVGLWLQLSKLSFTGMQFLLSGDFNQFSPIGNSFRGSLIAENAFEKSGLLHTLAGGNKVELTECRRSDAELFSFYSSLIAGGSRFELGLTTAVREAKELLNYDGLAEHNLVISHQKRIKLNREPNQQLATLGSIRLEVTGKASHGNSAQTMLLWPGIVLIGCLAVSKHSIQNGVLYTVESVTREAVVLTGGVSLTPAQAKSSLRLSFAQTYASCQGSEFDGPLRLHDTGHKFFSLKHLFVGLSRAKVAAEVGLV